VNPGSITGAFSATAGDVNPSFVLMDVQASHVTLYVYQIVAGEVKVEKVEFSK
jgi:vacuolar protein sorting-associated protein 29